ncbi:hypothetical protein [Caldisalinibacter kiritimatiensis]|uniref:Uncharacterized protein n=1 Tax=Caldisalinibacter kiritimatiensis TaxID=1304284 RepID=R1AS52_9FIRM|nr:hypothetical protein [Caldisalinibacter kiritimatiensis]EOC99962.1 hypothetical protein L21TH_2007 [Caldisalinibacter kiritimatiensis]
MNNSFDPSPGDPIMEQDLNYITENVCIITDKVYAHCQQRECFPDVEVDLEGKKFESIKFKPGFIVPNTLVVTELTNRPNFKRVRFTLRIPYEITTKEGSVIEGFLPDILKDIVLFIPDDVRDEFDFRIVVETSSKVLDGVIESDGTINFAVGVFIIVKVVGRVQLLIPAYGFCPEPPECEEFSPDGDICERFFEYEPFPDFFPPQFEDIYPDVD